MDWLEELLNASLSLADAWLLLDSLNTWGPTRALREDPVMTATAVASPPDTVPVFPPEWPQDLQDGVMLLWLARRKAEEDSAARWNRLHAALVAQVSADFGSLAAHVEIDWAWWPSEAGRAFVVRLPGCKPLTGTYARDPDSAETWVRGKRYRLVAQGAPILAEWPEAVLTAWEADQSGLAHPAAPLAKLEDDLLF